MPEKGNLVAGVPTSPLQVKENLPSVGFENTTNERRELKNLIITQGKEK